MGVTAHALLLAFVYVDTARTHAARKPVPARAHATVRAVCVDAPPADLSTHVLVIGAFVHVGAIPARTESVTRFAIASIGARRVPTMAVATHARVAAAFVHVATRPTTLCGLVTRIARAFEPAIDVGADAIGAHAAVCELTLVLVRAAPTAIHRVISGRTATLERAGFIDTTATFAIVEGALVNVHTKRVAIHFSLLCALLAVTLVPAGEDA